MGKAARVFVVGSIITIAIVVYLWATNRRKEAVAVWVVSPFPTPPGM